MAEKEVNSSKTGVRAVALAITAHVCNVCQNAYQSKREALHCSRLPIEKKIFEVGDTVLWREPRTCSSNNKEYVAEGKITRIVLEPPDEEYITKWLRSTINTHKWHITFKFRCPHCSEVRKMQVYQEELIKVK